MSPVSRFHTHSFPSSSSSSSSFDHYDEKPKSNTKSKSKGIAKDKGKGKLPAPATAGSSRSSKANKRRLKRMTGILPLLGLFLLVSWVGYPSITSPAKLSASSIHPAVQSFLEQHPIDAQYAVDGVQMPVTKADSEKEEAYVTFLSSIADPNYLLSTRFLIYQLLHDPSTSDSSQSRDVVVLTTPEIQQDTIDLLELDGAMVKQVELLDGFDLPEKVNDHWKDQYTKLNIFNMTEYTQILYMDNDVFLLKSLEDIWTSPSPLDESRPLGGVGETSKALLKNSDLRLEPPMSVRTEDKDYVNAGFMLIRPSTELFEELRRVKGYDTFYMEQALINHYSGWEGDHPWTPLNPKLVSHFPKAANLAEGYYSLHAKMWKDPVDQIVTDMWREGIQKMEDYWRSRDRA
ncbi:uncharacterized protein I303_102988 [Kwoniella dejecticola CBS 10117]|uniref:Glycosyl transferase family 8 protein n=1 Tax=Kwoniella dejecticola CBS 10117 TaxID=1296121 RepID=A0A1A6AAA2_9TREE|nr:uncharacterized protein I303_03008 [Kwoniella dejecticola CBS 10117]OBR86986.1 hypothetical protein I303_03008 [Kwoniella dejecticola CBS 10117]